MKNHYTKPSKSLWLKSLLLTLFTCCFAIPSIAQNNSKEVDFGEMKLDKEYSIKGDLSNYKGYFVAKESGTLNATASYDCLMLPYNDEQGTSQPEYNHIYLDNGLGFSMNVEAGKTYYLYLAFAMSDGTFKLSMSQENSIEFVAASPANNTEFDLSEGGLVSVKFTKHVAISSAMINCNQTMTEVEYTIQNENVVFDLKNRIYDLMANGNLKAGDQFALILDGVHAENDEKAILGEDGTLVLTYTLAEMPIALDSTINVENNPFLSYWIDNNEKGIITLIFNGELQSSKERNEAGIATLTCGELEAEVGGFYREELPYSVQGNKLTINLTGKLRRHSDMLSADIPLEWVTIKVKDIRGKNGKLAYFPGKGGLGSYTFDMPYQEIKAEPTSEFTPGANTELDNVETLEIWVTDYKSIQHEGILFTFENGTKKDSVVVTSFEEIADPDFENAYILNVKVPAEVKAHKGNVTVSFLHLTCIDGLNHNADLQATYTVVTGISSHSCTENKVNSIFQLNGVKVSEKNPQDLDNGLYIINGKKVIVCHK